MSEVLYKKLVYNYCNMCEKEGGFLMEKADEYRRILQQVYKEDLDADYWKILEEVLDNEGSNPAVLLMVTANYLNTKRGGV